MTGKASFGTAGSTSGFEPSSMRTARKLPITAVKSGFETAKARLAA